MPAVLSGLLLVCTPAVAQAQLLDLFPADAEVEVLQSYDDDLLLRATNHGPMAATLTVELTLPPALTVPALPDGCTPRPTGMRCRTPELQPGSYTTFPLLPVPTDRGTHRVTAVVTSPLTDPTTGNNVASGQVRRMPSPAVSADPVASSVAVSAIRFGHHGADHAVLARHDVHADALAATPLTLDGPLLLTPPDGLDAAVAAELDRVLPEGATVYLMGGLEALTPRVGADVEALGLVDVRLAGHDRFATSRAAAGEVLRLHPGTALAVTSGVGSWADPAAAGAWAAAMRMPLVLADPDPAVTAAWATASGITATTVVGGEAAVGDLQAAALPDARRVAGPDRAATAAALAAETPSLRFHLADGWSPGAWPAALLAAGLAADEGAPLLWVQPETAPGPTRAAVSSCRLRPVDLAVVGHTVTHEVRVDLDALDGDPRC